MNDIPSILINSKNLKEADRKITKIKKIKDLFENILKQM